MASEDPKEETAPLVQEEEEEKKDEEMTGAKDGEAADADAKAEEAEEGKEEETKEEAAKPKEPEKPKEFETDAADETRPKVTPGTVDFSSHDATLNVMPTANNRLLMALTEGGFQYLLAGVRSTVGLKSGRYLFEAKIVESHSGKGDQGATGAGQNGQGPMPRQQVRLGLSTAGSSLFLADGSSGSVSFDSEGYFVHEKSRKRVSQKFGRDVTVALLINLDESSPNANTISLFRDGVRICEPQAIPEKLKGKPLFPTITYKNVTLQVNFGPAPMRPLPFKCHMLSEAAAADVEVAVVPKPADGKYEVLFPVGLPDVGYFDWVDQFVERNPSFVELSDRKIVEWAVKSGMWKPKGAGHSNDKPDMKFGLPQMDDMSVRRLLSHIAPTARRNFIIPELKANLVASERAEALARFTSPEFKKTATVIVGEPTAEYKARVQELLIAEKKRKAEAEKKKKSADGDRKKLLEEKKKKAAAAKRKREGGDEEAKEEEEEEKEEPAADGDIVVELTDEEKALSFRKLGADITENLLAKAYAFFSLPTTEEGFASVSYAWSAEEAAGKTLKDWIFAKKLTQRVEDLKAGESFKEAWTAWQKTLSEWRKLQQEWKDPSRRKALLAKKAEAKKKEAEEKGDEAPKEDAKMEIDFEELDVFAVEDVKDLGDGRPLFSDYVFEDWTLLSVRYELHILLHCFKKDLNDPDRPSFSEKDLAFYYNKYFKKQFGLKTFAVEKLADLADLIKDTFSINEKTTFLEAALTDDTPITNFVKLTEDHRRERQRRLDAGDETAELKFPRNHPQPPPRGPPSRNSSSAPQGRWNDSGRPAVGGRYAPASSAPPARSQGSAPPPRSAPSYSGASSAQKRAYTPPPATSSSYVGKQPRTSAYGSYSGGSGSYYRR